jgi:hypothetical protein
MNHNLVACAIIGILLGVLVIFLPSGITQLSHIAIHEPGSCHIDSECKLGQICYRECLDLTEAGCINQKQEGYCTSLCDSDSNCINETCQVKLIWKGSTGQQLNICVK